MGIVWGLGRRGNWLLSSVLIAIMHGGFLFLIKLQSNAPIISDNSGNQILILMSIFKDKYYFNFRDRRNRNNMFCKIVCLMQDRLRNQVLQLFSSQCVTGARPLV